MQPRLIKILRRTDGKFVTVGDMSGGSPLGVDVTLHQAMGTAVREATALSRAARRPIAIAVAKGNGRFKVEQIVRPPLAIRRNPRPARTKN